MCSLRGKGASIMSWHRVSDLGVNYRNYSSNFHHVITHRQRKCMIITLILLVKCNNFITLMRDSCLKGTLKCTQAGTNEPTKNEVTKEERTNKRRGPRREGWPIIKVAKEYQKGEQRLKPTKGSIFVQIRKLRISLIMYFKCSSINPPWLSLHHPELGSTPP